MQRPALLQSILILALTMSQSANAQLKEPKGASDQALVAATAKRLLPCFTTTGVTQAFPETRDLPPEKNLVSVTLLGASGKSVSDGYTYWIAIESSRSYAYVRQVGGFAGSNKLYGPIPISTECK